MALGNVAFAYSYSFILIEICDTIRAPRENETLKKASWISILITSFCATLPIAASCGSNMFTV